MHKRTILYRGNLKSCNYSCSYCPFAKHRALASEMERDRQNFAWFCDSIVKRAQDFSIGAVFVTPYGEASIHRWYWEGLSRLAELPEIDRVGLQTNLSFSVEECLNVFDSFGREYQEEDSFADTHRKIDSPVKERSETDHERTGLVEADHEGTGSKEADHERTGSVEADLGGIDPERADHEKEIFLREKLSKGELLKEKRAKLSVWATFHPEMTTVDAFVSKCHSLIENNILVCAGAVGAPDNIQILRELREKLSPAVYLWINRMDGLKRNYSPEETEAFVQIDPFFEYELRNPEAAVHMCTDRCFVEADGRIHTCNISRTKAANWYDGGEEEIFEPVCSRKRCSCYLAYGGRADFAPKNVFGEYPVFRVPRKFRAVFFDLDGTLIPACRKAGGTSKEPYGGAIEPGIGRSGPGNPGGTPDVICKRSDILCTGFGMSAGNRRGSELSDEVRGRLTALREVCPVFLATSMPESAVKRRLRGDMDLFQGFIFASGGYLRLKEKERCREKVYPIDVSGLSEVIRTGESIKAKCVVSAKNGAAYKITFVKSRHSIWKAAECGRIAELLKKSDCRFFTEGNCLEIVRKGRDKGTGIAEICGWIGIPAEDVLAVGNDREDAAMERVCGGYINVG